MRYFIAPKTVVEAHRRRYVEPMYLTTFPPPGNVWTFAQTRQAFDKNLFDHPDCYFMLVIPEDLSEDYVVYEFNTMRRVR